MKLVTRLDQPFIFDGDIGDKVLQLVAYMPQAEAFSQSCLNVLLHLVHTMLLGGLLNCC